MNRAQILKGLQWSGGEGVYIVEDWDVTFLNEKWLAIAPDETRFTGRTFGEVVAKIREREGK